MMEDGYDVTTAEEILSSAPRPGSPAARLLAASEDLFILDTRDFDSDRWQPSAIDWIEETGAARVSCLSLTVLGSAVVLGFGALIGLLGGLLAWLTMGAR